MNKAINTVTLISNINIELELKSSKSGKSFLNVNLLCPDSFFMDKMHEFTVVCWRDDADYLAKCASKGSQIVVTGKLAQRHFTKGGLPQSVIEIFSEDVLVISSTKPIEAPEEDFPEPPDEPGEPQE